MPYEMRERTIRYALVVSLLISLVTLVIGVTSLFVDLVSGTVTGIVIVIASGVVILGCSRLLIAFSHAAEREATPHN